MQRSLDTAISGLMCNQDKMDVIANNVANVNSIGYKKSRANFSDRLYDKIRNSGAASKSLGGTNSINIGLGSKLSSIDSIQTQGPIESTGRDLDLAIQGDGFFAVTEGSNKFYTRNGNFQISDGDSVMCLPNGMKLLGYMADSKGNIDKTHGLSEITLPLNTNMTAQATSKVTMVNNLDKKLAVGSSTDVPISVYDSLGTKYDLDINISITAAGQANYKISDPSGKLTLGGNTGTISFNSDGTFKAQTGGPITFTNAPASPVSFTMDLSGTTYFDSDTTLTLKNQDGCGAGTLEGFSIDDGGIINGNFSNGTSKILGAIPIIKFDNAQGLDSIGDGLFSGTSNSGNPLISTGGGSKIISKSLESSNVDIGEELTEMIKTQRNYDVNSKVITTSDEMLQDLINMKR